MLDLEYRRGEAEAVCKVPLYAGFEIGELVRVQCVVAAVDIGELLPLTRQETLRIACVDRDVFPRLEDHASTWREFLILARA